MKDDNVNSIKMNIVMIVSSILVLFILNICCFYQILGKFKINFNYFQVMFALFVNYI